MITIDSVIHRIMSVSRTRLKTVIVFDYISEPTNDIRLLVSFFPFLFITIFSRTTAISKG